MGEGDGLAIIDGSGVNAAALELVDECRVVVGTNAGPASVLYLGVKNGY